MKGLGIEIPISKIRLYLKSNRQMSRTSSNFSRKYQGGFGDIEPGSKIWDIFGHTGPKSGNNWLLHGGNRKILSEMSTFYCGNFEPKR